MADAKIPHKNTLRLQKFTHQKLQYMLLDRIGGSGSYVDVNTGDDIKIESNHGVLIIRYEYKNKHTDGFQIKELTGNIRLIGYQFRMEKENGTLWSVNVFLVEQVKKKEDEDIEEHDSDIEPPEPRIP